MTHTHFLENHVNIGINVRAICSHLRSTAQNRLLPGWLPDWLGSQPLLPPGWPFDMPAVGGSGSIQKQHEICLTLNFGWFSQTNAQEHATVQIQYVFLQLLFHIVTCSNQQN